MKIARIISLWSTLLLAVIFASSARAQPAKPDYEPRVGQAGKDVVWVPTPQALVDKMLDMAKVTPSDYVIDLGSGDGRTVITAAKPGSNVGVMKNGRMPGEETLFTAGETDYTGRVSGDTITGVSKTGANWKATRDRP